MRWGGDVCVKLWRVWVVIILIANVKQDFLIKTFNSLEYCCIIGKSYCIFGKNSSNFLTPFKPLSNFPGPLHTILYIGKQHYVCFSLQGEGGYSCSR